MRLVEFVDTSILTNLVDVPGKNQDRQLIGQLLREKTEQGVTFILPVSAIVETGNHVVHVQDGGLRRRCAERFTTLLRRVAAGDAPFVLHEIEWNQEFLLALCDGVEGTGAFVELATAGTLGTGDLGILVERRRYLDRTALVEAAIWTLDGPLSAYS